MNLRVLICGMLGGLLQTLALSLPLYVVLLARYAREWQVLIFPSAQVLTVGGSVLAVLVALGTGFTAARWCWQTAEGSALRTGALTGLLAGMIAFSLVGAPAVGVFANALVYEHGAKAVGDEVRAVHLLTETVVRISWYPYLAFAAFVAAGSLLGGLGGALNRQLGGEPWGTPPPLGSEETVDASIALLAVTALTLTVTIGAVDGLEQNVKEAVARHGLSLSLPVAGVFAWPVGMAFLALTLATWYSGRWCASRWSHPIHGVHRTAVIGAICLAAAPLLTLAVILLRIQPALLFRPVFLAGAAIWIGVAAYWLLQIRNREPCRADAAPPPPSFRDRLLINAGLVGILYPTIMMVIGLSQSLSLGLGVVLFINVLFDRPAGVDDIAPTVGGSMQQIYVAHYLFALYMSAAWICLALIHALAILGWNALLRRQSAASEPQPSTVSSA